MKILVIDSGTIINFSMNGLIPLLVDLKKIFNGKFIMTDDVKYETIERPLKIKRFELEALIVQKLLKDGILEPVSSIGINEDELKEKKKDVLKQVNSAFSAREEFVHLIDDGEASCLALCLLAKEKNIDSVMAVDERTARMIVESPEKLRRLFENKIHTKVRLLGDLSFLEGIKVIRSSEMVYVAYKKGLIKMENNLLDALLYATKYKGCSISQQEIEEAKRI